MIVKSEELREKTTEFVDDAKSFVRYFSGAKTQDLHHYIVPSLLKEKSDIFVIHVISNDTTHWTFKGFSVGNLTDKIINIGKTCRQYEVKDVTFSSIFMEK